jgi:hypothetical protein
MRCKLSVIAVVTATLAMPATALGFGMGGGHGGHFGGAHAHAHAHFGHMRVAGGHGRHGRTSESSCFIIFEPFCLLADAFRR